MNERVKAIADKIWSLDTEPNPHFNLCLQEFAELIVQECLLAIDNTNTHHIYTTYDQGMVLGTIEKSKKAVKEHFGVE